MKQGGPTRTLVIDGVRVSLEIEEATSVVKRLKGLLGTNGLRDGLGLWIEPCNSVHTCFMSYPIDVVFLDRGGRVLTVDRDVLPWRMLSCWRARAVLELGAGQAERWSISVDTRVVRE